jgi:SAM-dependent methyltransferase
MFLPWMEQVKTIAPAQADGLRKIFEKHGVHEGARVLDLAGGIGRISINLAKIGYDVVGVDISPLYLELAERWAVKEGVEDRVRFYRVDGRDAARQLRKKQGKFDAIINIGTSMGYYGEEDDLRTFTSLRNITGPRALLVIETVNRDYLVKNFQTHSISLLDGIEWHESRKLNLETSFMENSWKFYRKARGSLRLSLDINVSHRVYSLHELKKLVESAGWKYLESYGSLRQLTPLTTDSPSVTIVSRNT